MIVREIRGEDSLADSYTPLRDLNLIQMHSKDETTTMQPLTSVPYQARESRNEMHVLLWRGSPKRLLHFVQLLINQHGEECE